MPVFDPDDFAINPKRVGDEVQIDHFEVDDDLRGQKIGSAIIETLKRVYYYESEVEKLTIRMGGGDAAKEFLEANGFTVTNKEYNADFQVEGDYIVSAEYSY